MQKEKRKGEPLELEGKEVRFRGKLVRIAYLDGEGYQFLSDPESAMQLLRKSGKRADIFTFMQKISEPQPKYGYPMEWDNVAAISITTFDNWMSNQLSSRVRSIVRKTAKDGVTVKEVPFDDQLIAGISEVYNEVPIRQGRRFGHFGIDIESLRRMKATFLDRSIFLGAYFEGRMIGFIKLVVDEDRGQAGIMHILSMVKHRDKAPTNALIAQAVRSCADRAIPYLWYVKFYYGKKGHDSLTEFKRRNGFQKIDVPRYYVPLTPLGRTALSLGLHRELGEWIPSSVSATYRRARSFWYAKKFPGLEGA
jgi:hypothetical protein